MPVLDEGLLITQIERIIQSEALRGSEAQRNLLKFLAEKSLTGEAGQLKEYSVAVDALGRPPTYDPRHDSSVRVQMGRLRQRLAEYYQTEGKDDPILVEVPKGRFKLTWQPRPQTLPDSRAVDPGAAMLWRWALVAAGVLFLIVLAWSIHLYSQLLAERKETAVFRSKWTPELATLWTPFLNSDRPLLVSLGAPLFVDFPNIGYFRERSLNRAEDVFKSKNIEAIRQALKTGAVQPKYIYSLSGNANVGFMLGSLLATRKTNVSLISGGELSWTQLTENNVVFVGSQKFLDPSLARLPVAPEFVTEPGVGFRNLNPLKGEPATYSDIDPPGNAEGVAWVLISHQPGPNGTGEIRSFQSRINAGLVAAVQMFTEPVAARTVLSKLRSASGEFPRYYQVLLKVRFQGPVPLETSLVLFRELH
jgi:hypothetical protein